MTDRLPQYGEYRGTELLWLRQIPAHWTLRRNGSLFQQRNQTGFGGLPILEVSLKTGVRVRDLESPGRKQVMSDLDGYKRARRGDLAYNMMRMWQGAVGAAPVDGLVSPAYVVARPNPGTSTEYYSHLFRSPAYMAEVDKYSRGIVKDRNRLYWDQFKQMPSPVPPPEEQQAIVRFLDHVDRRVRRAIRGRQRLIGLLEEYRQAVIHRAVTRGLEPDVRLKPSGVEWLGDIPAHWRVARLKDVADVQTGLTLGKDYKGVATESFPYLRVANVQAGRLDLLHVKHVEVPLAEARTTRLQDGDVLMTEGGDIDKLGRGCVWSSEINECLHQNHVFAVRCCRTLVDPEYLVALMGSQLGRGYFQLTAKQTTNLASTNSSTLRAFPVFLPPLLEQRSILEDLRGHTLGVDKAVADAAREILLLRELRTRLIADVVTGKLDVREAAVRLPLDDDLGHGDHGRGHDDHDQELDDELLENGDADDEQHDEDRELLDAEAGA